MKYIDQLALTPYKYYHASLLFSLSCTLKAYFPDRFTEEILEKRDQSHTARVCWLSISYPETMRRSADPNGFRRWHEVGEDEAPPADVRIVTSDGRSIPAHYSMLVRLLFLEFCMLWDYYQQLTTFDPF